MCHMILIMGRQIRSKRQRRLSQVMDEFSITHELDQDQVVDVVAANNLDNNNNNNNNNNANNVRHALGGEIANNRAHNNNEQHQQHQQQQEEQHHQTSSCKSLWKLVKVPVLLLGSLFGLGDHYMSDYFDSMGTGDALRDARLRVWLRQDPSLADRHYMMVQSGMRYSFFLY